MKTITVKNVVLGDGIPKICIPVVAKTKEAIIEEIKGIQQYHADLVEWRVDWFEHGDKIEKIKEVLQELSPIIKDFPLLFTFRTAEEGGNRKIDTESYVKINREAAATGIVDLIDVELFKGDAVMKELVESAHHSGVKVVASSHDFEKTPPKDEILYRLRKMQDLGADISKIAVMPKSSLDVLELLEATVIMKEKYADKPIITMSMSGTGVVSRLTGEFFGSALTFGAAKKASAPGQIGVEDLYHTLHLLHNSL
ncbi:MAG: type I 3-dehydroquinate dehydratase [Oscillospiraceae bacterium]|nr:type I 3-dehydroquinate dehydratase [Oscillospiraceae bacterium]